MITLLRVDGDERNPPFSHHLKTPFMCYMNDPAGMLLVFNLSPFNTLGKHKIFEERRLWIFDTFFDILERMMWKFQFYFTKEDLEAIEEAKRVFETNGVCNFAFFVQLEVRQLALEAAGREFERIVREELQVNGMLAVTLDQFFVKENLVS